MIRAVIYYFLPLSIIGILYALMARRLHLSAREIPGELSGPSQAQARARRHVARMVVTFVIGELSPLKYATGWERGLEMAIKYNSN